MLKKSCKAQRKVHSLTSRNRTPDLTFSEEQSPIGSSPKFLADGMLGSIARKLRILGFDTIFDSKSKDRDLAQSALSTGRILLTGDFELFVYAKSLKIASVLVQGQSEAERLHQVLSKSGVSKIKINSLVSRCSVCNGELVDLGTKKSNDGEIYCCKSCGKNYWKGSHWIKMNILFEQVNSRLIEDAHNGKNKKGAD